jgi:outer membrane protein assembly factor BamA
MRARLALFILSAGMNCFSVFAAPTHAQKLHPYRCTAADEEKTDSPDEKTGYPPIILHDLKFDGKLTIPESDLHEYVSSVMQRKLYADPEWFDRIAEEARGVWQNQGYFKVLIDPEPQIFSLDSAAEHAFLTIHVEEGPKFWLKDIRFRKADLDSDAPDSDSPSRPTLRRRSHQPTEQEFIATAKPAPVFPAEQLRKLIPLQDGDVLNTEKIREGLDAIKELYGANGYINFVTTPNTAIDDKEKRVSIMMELDEDKQFRIAKIETRNNDFALDQALQNEFPPGSIFEVDRWNQTIKKLLPGLSPENIELHKHQSNGTVDLMVDTRPCSPMKQ